MKKGLTDTEAIYGEADIVWWSAVNTGEPMRQRLRGYRIVPMERCAQFDRAVSVWYVEPRRRRWHGFVVKNDDLVYVTIEKDGRVVWDSRADVPCDMTKWLADQHKFQARWQARGIR